MYDFFENKFEEDEFEIEKEMIKSKNKVALSMLLAIVIIVGICGYGLHKANQFGQDLFAGSDELIQKSSSPSGKYTIKAYLHNSGATVDWAVKCDLIINNKEKKTKRIYSDYHIKEASIIWIDKDTVSINNHTIDLPHGSYDWRKDKSRS